MKGAGLRRVYAALVAALLVGVAVWRRDLFSEAFRVTWAQLSAGGAARWMVLAEIALFFVVVAPFGLVWARVEPTRDALVLLTAAWVGYAGESWGTRNGLWEYYTLEKPPLWLVAAWPLGALVVQRVGAEARARWGGLLGRRACRTGYWLMAAYCFAVFAAFSWPWVGLSGTVAMLAIILASLAAAPSLPEDFWFLAAGLAYACCLEIWGTTNHCWAYYTQAGGGVWRGVAFGMVADTVLSLGCWKCARLLLSASADL